MEIWGVKQGMEGTCGQERALPEQGQEQGWAGGWTHTGTLCPVLPGIRPMSMDGRSSRG